jgi:hypothetical protein
MTISLYNKIRHEESRLAYGDRAPVPPPLPNSDRRERCRCTELARGIEKRRGRLARLLDASAAQREERLRGVAQIRGEER